MRLFLICGAAAIAGAASAFATGQIPDAICVDGVLYSLFTNPLEQLYENQKRPAFVDSLEGSSSGNWRGYVASWQIHEDHLYLIAIDTFVRNKRVGVRQLFPGRMREGRVLANWFSGDLRVPDGKQLQYVHMGYGSTYERDIVLRVQNGRVVSRTVVDNRRKRPPKERDRGEEELKKLDEWATKTKQKP